MRVREQSMCESKRKKDKEKNNNKHLNIQFT